MPTKTSRNYCFTAYSKPEPTLDQVQYLVYGEEVCPTTQKIHWQGYVEFKGPKSLTAAKKIMNDNTMHFEVRRGSQDQAIAYCKKDNKWIEHGERARQGRRTDLDEVIKECKTVDEVMDKYPQTYCSYRQGLKDIYARRVEQNIPNIRPIEVVVYWGVTGSGKTYKAVTENPDHYRLMHTKASDRINFDGYTGQPVLIIDEFYGQIDYPYFLQLLDQYKLQLHVKGSTTWAQWNKVIITSNEHPHTWYKDQHNIDAMMRRIKTIVNFDKQYQERTDNEESEEKALGLGTKHVLASNPDAPTSPLHKRQKTEITSVMSDFHIDVLSDCNDNDCVI